MNLITLLCLFYACTNVIYGTKIPTNVLDLNEKFLDVMNNGYWFVMFYAPWCAHCKRLHPTWEHMAHALVEKSPNLKVGKVDVTRFPQVSSALKIHAFPTIIFFRNGNQIHYDGERKKESMVQFAERSAGPVIGNLDSVAAFNEKKKISAKDPIFVYLKTDETKENELFKEFQMLSEQLFTHVQFYQIDPKFVLFETQNAPSNVFVLKDVGHVFYNPKSENTLSEWVSTERWPLLPQITGSNIYTIANSSGKKLVILLVEPGGLLGKVNLTSPTGR